MLDFWKLAPQNILNGEPSVEIYAALQVVRIFQCRLAVGCFRLEHLLVYRQEVFQEIFIALHDVQVLRHTWCPCRVNIRIRDETIEYLHIYFKCPFGWLLSLLL